MKSSRHHLAEIIGKQTLTTKDHSKLVQGVAAYLLEEGRVSELEPLMRDVIAYRAKHGIIEATAVTAYGLSNDIKDEIKAMLKQDYPHIKTITLDEKIDPSVVGGVRLELPGEQLDATVAAKLNLFKRLTAQERN